jgi:5-methylcytosine-specific restriction endonuclease McrA
MAKKEDYTGEKRTQRSVSLAGRKCAKCGSTEDLMRHHKDGNKRNVSPGNIEILCRRCHGKTKNWPHRPKGS